MSALMQYDRSHAMPAVTNHNVSARNVADEAAAQAGWHPAHMRRILLEFIQAEIGRDPEIGERLLDHLDDAVAATYRGRTAFVR